MKFKYFIMLVLVLSIIMSSCDELTNPTSEFLIDKTVSVSSTEQIIESGNDIKIIIPANSLKGDLGLKIKKEVSIPAFSVTNTKLGSNVYKISFTGNTAFSSPIKIIISYDKSKIPAGKTVAEIVKGYIYANSNWKIGSYVIDETNSKIIFSVSNLATPKINKDIPELQAEGDVTFGDAYNTTDTGQNDEYLVEIQKSFNISIDFSGYHSGINNGEWSSIHFPPYFDMGSESFVDPLVWNGNAFSVANSETTINGTIDSKNKTISLTAITVKTKLNETLVKISSELNLQNVPYEYNSMIYGHVFGIGGGGQKVKDVIKSITYTKTIFDKDKTDKIIEQFEYTGTDYSKNADIEIHMMHK